MQIKYLWIFANIFAAFLMEKKDICKEYYTAFFKT